MKSVIALLCACFLACPLLGMNKNDEYKDVLIKKWAYHNVVSPLVGKKLKPVWISNPIQIDIRIDTTSRYILFLSATSNNRAGSFYSVYDLKSKKLLAWDKDKLEKLNLKPQERKGKKFWAPYSYVEYGLTAYNYHDGPFLYLDYRSSPSKYERGIGVGSSIPLTNLPLEWAEKYGVTLKKNPQIHISNQYPETYKSNKGSYKSKILILQEVNLKGLPFLALFSVEPLKIVRIICLLKKTYLVAMSNTGHKIWIFDTKDGTLIQINPEEYLVGLQITPKMDKKFGNIEFEFDNFWVKK